jgi:hypothetical protein
MGLIADLDSPTLYIDSFRSRSQQRRASKIESDTPILPRAIAEAVMEEASLYLGQELPRSWIAKLTFAPKPFTPITPNSANSSAANKTPDATGSGPSPATGSRE